MISGGSSLPPEVLKTFYGMGFDFFEGYGLTETARPLGYHAQEEAGAWLGGPAIARCRGQDRQPRRFGVARSFARGRNVMAGYWENPEATAQAIRERLVPTRRSGRFDEDGNLFIVGRSKESSSTPTARTSTPTRSRISTAAAPSSRSSRWSGCPMAWPSTWPARWCPISIRPGAGAGRGTGQDRGALS